jgi:Ser/Thr protein kinase RdoA (MazF antagonist)
MDVDLFSEILSHWDIPSVRLIEQASAGETSSGNVAFVETESGARFVLKRKTVARTLQNEYRLLEILAAQGVPVAVPLRTPSGDSYIQVGEHYFDLSPHLPGTVYGDHYAPGSIERARQFGAAIARLHTALCSSDPLVSAQVMDLPGDIARFIPVVRSLWPVGQPPVDPILAELEAGLAACHGELPMQLIHRDAHPGNMLFLDGELSGWLDFEIMVRGPRLFDLCYCSTSLLIYGFDDPVKRQAWHGLVRP